MADLDLDAIERVALDLRSFAAAYPENVFPTPPEHLRAKDAVAADVMRSLASPTFIDAADTIDALVAEVRRLRAVRDAAQTVVGRAEMVSTRDQIPVTVQVGIDRLDSALEEPDRG